MGRSPAALTREDSRQVREALRHPSRFVTAWSRAVCGVSFLANILDICSKNRLPAHPNPNYTIPRWVMQSFRLSSERSDGASAGHARRSGFCAIPKSRQLRGAGPRSHADRLQIYNLIMRLGASELLTPQLLAQVDSTGPLALQREVGPAESATARAPGYFGEVVLLMMMLEQ